MVKIWKIGSCKQLECFYNRFVRQYRARRLYGCNTCGLVELLVHQISVDMCFMNIGFFQKAESTEAGAKAHILGVQHFWKVIFIEIRGTVFMFVEW